MICWDDDWVYCLLCLRRLESKWAKLVSCDVLKSKGDQIIAFFVFLKKGGGLEMGKEKVL